MGFTRFSKDHSVFWKASGTSATPEQKNMLRLLLRGWNIACTKACKHLARYIKKTRDLGLRYHANDGLINKAYQCADIFTKVKFPSIFHFISLRDIVMGKIKNNLKELESWCVTLAGYRWKIPNSRERELILVLASFPGNFQEEGKRGPTTLHNLFTPYSHI